MSLHLLFKDTLGCQFEENPESCDVGVILSDASWDLGRKEVLPHRFC